MYDGASDIAQKVDSVFLYITLLTAAFLVFITVLMIVFVVKYSRKKNARPKDIEGHAGLEILWTVIPLVLFLTMFYFGWTNFRYMRSAPADAMTVQVIGRQWVWSFTYPNGKKTPELYVAENRPVRLELTSPDVIHGFFIPAFRVKQDVVPGQFTMTWFTPTRLGSYDIECTVICGVSHTYMLSKVHVVPEAEFKEWYFGDGEKPPASVAAEQARFRAAAEASKAAGGPDLAQGSTLFREKGCATCHTTDGSKLVGPSVKGLYGSARAVVDPLGRERTVAADEEFLRRSIQMPAIEIAKGFPPAMPDQRLSPKDLEDIVAYLKTVR